MYAHVLVETPDGRHVRLGHGDFIGRLCSAALHLDDPRVSEAHALVSLRLGELRLLALRGRFAVGRQRLSDLRLVPGLEITLSADTRIKVLAVVTPRELLGIEGEGLDRQILPGACGLVVDPTPALVSPLPVDPDVTFWHNGSGWRYRPRGARALALMEGDTWTVAGRTFRAVVLEAQSSGEGVTVIDGGLERPLRIVAQYDTVHVYRGDKDPEPAVVSGVAARVISELAAMDAPVPWRILAAEVWGELGEASLRRRLDVACSRLRTRLREQGVRPDLVRATGTGHYELFLHQRDSVEDRS